jgi:hypothetical protein
MSKHGARRTKTLILARSETRSTGDDDNNQRGTMDLGEARRVEDRDVDSCMVEDSEHQRRQRRPTGDRGFGRVESRHAAARNGLGF